MAKKTKKKVTKKKAKKVVKKKAAKKKAVKKASKKKPSKIPRKKKAPIAADVQMQPTTVNDVSDILGDDGPSYDAEEEPTEEDMLGENTDHDDLLY